MDQDAAANMIGRMMKLVVDTLPQASAGPAAEVLAFRGPGAPAPAKQPRMPHKPPANSPPFRRCKPSAEVRRAIEAAPAREGQ